MTKPFVRKETEAKQNEKQILHNQCTFGNTRTYGRRLADVHLAGFSPHSLCRCATVKLPQTAKCP